MSKATSMTTIIKNTFIKAIAVFDTKKIKGTVVFSETPSGQVKIDIDLVG